MILLLLDYVGNTTTIIIGKQYQANNAKEETEWDDFFERLNNLGYVEIKKYDSHGYPIYKSRKSAYDFIESLK